MQAVSLLSSMASRPALNDKAGPVMYTTIVDGIDLRLPITSLKQTPVERSAIGNGIFGKVHFLWPEDMAVTTITVMYADLTKEQARRLIAALGPRTIHGKTLSFVRDANAVPVAIPGAVSLRVSAQGQGLWSVILETTATPNLYAVGTAGEAP